MHSSNFEYLFDKLTDGWADKTSFILTILVKLSPISTLGIFSAYPFRIFFSSPPPFPLLCCKSYRGKTYL